VNDGEPDLVYCRHVVRDSGTGYVTYVGGRGDTVAKVDRLEGCSRVEYARTMREALGIDSLPRVSRAVPRQF
jgi:hypothetical protein